jgi:hypothetical protein
MTDIETKIDTMKKITNNKISQSKQSDDAIIFNKYTNILRLYDDFFKADQYVHNLKKRTITDYKVTKINMISQIPKPKFIDSYFFPNYIHEYVNENASYILHYSSTIEGRLINIYFITFEPLDSKCIDQLNKAVHMIYMWIYILNIYSEKKCSKVFTLYTYLTPFTKILPDNQLTPMDTNHVNTAYTTGCKRNTEVVIFRKEEWFKVFIHETFHCFGLDFSNMNFHNVNDNLKEIFNVNIDYKLYESYCETWARIINVIFYSFNKIHISINDKNNNIKLNKLSFIKTFNKYMENESAHSMIQALKILQFMDLNYKLITHKSNDAILSCKHLYKEETAVFSYYIITGLLLNNYIDFINWCSDHNPKFILFDKTIININNYISFIEYCSSNNNVKKNNKKIEDHLSKLNYMDNKLSNKERNMIRSLRMSIIDNLI